MRILTLHCDYIRFKPTKKAIQKSDDLKDMSEKEVKDCLVVLTAVEQGDSDAILKQMLEAVEKTAKEVGAKNIVLYPYAHLSSMLAKPDTALEYLTEAEHTLAKKKYSVTRAPFGYYKEFELKCKGHPMSELSKEFREEGIESGKIAVTAVSSKDVKAKVETEKDISKLLHELKSAKLDTSKLKDNDHRILGQKLDLFSYNEASPGNTFWHPKGLIIFNELVAFSRELQKARGYQEVYTPQIFDNKLWKVSGHWDHYKDNMFITYYEGRESGVKPMNCPGHMLLFKTKTRSYKDLPLRFAEYAPLHRMELSGVLAGLLRVIRMHQDDSHIFCSMDHLEGEISTIMDLLKIIYTDTFGFKEIVVNLSTRGDKFMGDVKDWDRAEEALEKVLKNKKLKYVIKKGDGAFYGPKIDFDVKDSLGRSWQCGTIQLDMQLPKRFELVYTDSDGKEKTPIVIHRAVMGSLERFIGVLLEHLNGNMPVWLAPVQVKVVNFTDRNVKSAEKIVKQLQESIPSLRIEEDFRNTTVNDKIRDAEIQRIPYIIVIGDKEEQSETLAVRTRGSKKPQFGVNIEAFIKQLDEKIKSRTLEL